NLVPPRRVRDRNRDEHEEHDGAEQRDHDAARAARPECEELRAAPCYFRTGAPVAFASHCCRIPASVPFAFSRASALSTHDARGLPFANTMPKCSPPASDGNCPSTFECCTCAEVM